MTLGRIVNQVQLACVFDPAQRFVTARKLYRAPFFHGPSGSLSKVRTFSQLTATS